MVQVEIEEARNNLAELMARAASGEEIIIAQAGKPIVCLVPIAETPARGVSGGERGRRLPNGRNAVSF